MLTKRYKRIYMTDPLKKDRKRRKKVKEDPRIKTRGMVIENEENIVNLSNLFSTQQEQLECQDHKFKLNRLYNDVKLLNREMISSITNYLLGCSRTQIALIELRHGIPFGSIISFLKKKFQKKRKFMEIEYCNNDEKD